MWQLAAGKVFAVKKHMFNLRKPQRTRDWVAFLIGAVWIYFSGQQLVLGLWSYSWSKARGVITYSTPYNASRTYHVERRYKYNNQGRAYSGDVYRHMFIFNLYRMPSRDVDAIQARYFVGEAVEPYVNPWNPAQAVLEPGVDADAFLWFGAGFLIVLGGLLPDRAERGKKSQAAVAAATIAGEAVLGPKVIQPRYRVAKFLAVIGSLILLWGMMTLKTAWSSMWWPSAGGKVFYSRVVRARGGYLNQLWYEYYIQGTRYVSENYRVGGNLTLFSDVAKAASTRYPVGCAVKVFYNPADPTESVLETGAWYGNYIFAAIGLAILGAAYLAKKYAEAVIAIELRKVQNAERR